MGQFTVTVPILTDGSGNATVYSSAIQANVHKIAVAVGTLTNTVDLTFTEEDTTAAIVTMTNVTANRSVQPRVLVQDAAGADIAGAYTAPFVVGRVKIVVAQGGAAHTGTVTLYCDGQGAGAAEAAITRTFTPGAVFTSSSVQQGLPGGRANT